MKDSPTADLVSLRERARRMLIVAVIIGVIVAPGAVALAMMLTGNVGD